MAKLYFKYGTMNSGKSNALINTVYNYQHQVDNHGQAKECMVYTTTQDTRSGHKRIQSRPGGSIKAQYVTSKLFDEVEAKSTHTKIYAVLVDESQFLSKEQVLMLARVVDILHIPVLCYGLKTDFQGNLFEGSATLLAFADALDEQKTICFQCGNRKATLNLRLDSEGHAVKDGKQIEAGDSYIPVCRKCFILAQGED